MSEATTTAAPEGSETEATGQAPETGSDLHAEVEKWKALSKKNEERAKANAKAAQDLEKFRQDSLSETERAIEAARSEARKATLTEVGGKVAAAEIRVAAAGRLEAAQVDTLLEGLNLSRFVDDNGDVDRDAVAKFVDGIAPKAGVRGAVDQGARPDSSTPLNGDPLTRDLQAKLGIR